jgi:hypothetical protein
LNRRPDDYEMHASSLTRFFSLYGVWRFSCSFGLIRERSLQRDLQRGGPAKPDCSRRGIVQRVVPGVRISTSGLVRPTKKIRKRLAAWQLSAVRVGTISGRSSAHHFLFANIRFPILPSAATACCTSSSASSSFNNRAAATVHQRNSGLNSKTASCCHDASRTGITTVI